MKVKKIIKKTIKGIIIFVIVLIAALIAIPYFFQDQILEKIKQEANASLNAKVDFGDVNMSLLRSFPNFSLSLDDLKISGVDQFKGLDLVSADNIDFTLDIMSVIKSDRPIEIQTVTLDKPNINILILENGKANYDITKSSGSDSEGGADFLIHLRKYQIKDGNFTYDDRLGNVFVEVKDLDHSGKGDFTQDIFDLTTKTSIEQLTAQSGGVNYLKKANTNLDATFNIDLPNSKYTLAKNDLSINEMKLLVDGFVQMQNDDINIDFTFDAPSNDFKTLLSLIPNAYTQDFSDVKTDGKMAFNGLVKGTYNGTKNRMPAFEVNLDIDQGSFQYPSLPLGLNNIFTNVKISSPKSDLDKMVVDIPSLKFALDGEPFEGRFKLSSPISDPNIDTKIKGKIDLEKLNQAFPMSGVTEMSGEILADLEAKTRMSTLESGNYEAAKMDGSAQIKNLTYAATGLPKVDIQQSEIEFSPKYADLKSFDGKIGKSDLVASGKIDNILAYFSPEKTMTGDLKLRSKYFDINEWMVSPEEPSATNVIESDAELATTEVEIFDQFDFKFDAIIGKVDYDVYELKNSKASGHFSPKLLSINNFETIVKGSDFRGKGELTNIFDYVFKNGTLGGELVVDSDVLDLNAFMEPVEDQPAAKNISNTKEEYEPIAIPDNIDVKLKAKARKLIYTDLNLKDFSGDLDVADSRVKMKNVNARVLGGKFVADGFYDTKDPEKPQYELTYDINNFSFQNSFEKLNTVKMLAPITKYIEGNFSSKLKINGTLGKDLMPVFESIDADGFLQTTQGFIKDFIPFNKIGESLNIGKLKNGKINLKGTKNWFEVKDGKVVVKEFPLKYQGIDMKIAGSHGFTQNVDYVINAKVPTKLIDKNPVGNAAKKGLNLLNQQASKLNIKLDAGEFINVKINLTGSISDPKISFNLVGSEGQSVKDVIINKVEEVKDTVIAEVKEKVEDKREELEAAIQARKDKLNKEADQKIAAVERTAERTANKIRTEGKKAAEKARTEGYKQADALVEAAGKNPIKKRAAQIAAKKLKKETDKQVQKIEDNANKNADRVIDRSKEETKKIRREYDKKIEKVGR